MSRLFFFKEMAKYCHYYIKGEEEQKNNDNESLFALLSRVGRKNKTNETGREETLTPYRQRSDGLQAIHRRR